jgi:polysaccharide biosynthesis transport protein
MSDNETPGTNGDARRPRARLGGGKLERFVAGRDPAVERGTQLAGLTARPSRHGQGAPDGWSRFLLAHLAWILITTLLVVGAAAALAHHQTPKYKAEAEVNVWFASPDPTALVGPNMVTEKGIVSSGVVLAIAARSLGVPSSALQHGLSVSVPASSSILEIAYADPVPWVARERAQVIAESYVAYRTPKPAPAKKGAKAAPKINGVAPVVSTLRATVITPASLPTSPSSPNYLIDILAALVVGLALGIGTAALRDHLDDRFRTPFELEAQTGAPVLTLIPAVRWLTRRNASGLAMARNPDSVIAEAYRGLRTRVIAAAAERSARTLLITSPAWEDKSTVAANLAAALAQSGRRTVLVCADFRWGYANELFGVANDEGLTTVLDWDTNVMSALKVTGIRRLRVLTAGPLPADPAEFLQRPGLQAVLGELRGHADFVVIDAPPVLATPDTASLAHLAEMILLVGDARKSTRAQLRAALHEIADMTDQLIGCVLYNVGRRRWVRRSSLFIVADDRHEADAWSRPGPMDGHEVTPSGPPSTSSGPDAGPA